MSATPPKPMSKSETPATQKKTQRAIQRENTKAFEQAALAKMNDAFERATGR